MRVHIHTDSPFFSGDQNMLATLLNDEAFTSAHDIVLSYRSSPRYDAGLVERIPDVGAFERLPLELLDVPAVTDPLRPRALRMVAKGAFHLLGVKYAFVRANTRRLTRVFRQTRPDILHVNSGGYPGAYSTLSAVLAGVEAGVPRIVYVANNIAAPYTWRRLLDRSIDRRVARGVDVFVTGSEYAGRALAGVLGIDESKLRTIPNGIRPRPLTETPGEVRARLRVPSGRPLVAVVANLEARKGHVYLLDAVARLRREGVAPMPFLIIEGEGPEEATLRRMITGLGLADDVRMVGRERQVFDLINAADVLVLPSVGGEDFPNVVLEAMSLGRPVVATRVAGIPEQIVDGETGLVVVPGDHRALADALARVCGDSELRERMGVAGRARFIKCFTADRAAEAYRQLYRETLAVR